MFANLLEKMALALGRAEISYMIIGGQAVLLYGEPRLTRDIDVTLGLDVDQIERFLPVVEVIGLVPLADPQTFTRKTLVLPCRDPETDIRVDFIFSFSPYERQAMGRTRTVGIGRAEVRFAALEDLVVHKVVAGRPRDLEDVKSVLLKNPGADLNYIRRWLREFSEALAEPLAERFETLLKESSL